MSLLAGARSRPLVAGAAVAILSGCGGGSKTVVINRTVTEAPTATTATSPTTSTTATTTQPSSTPSGPPTQIVSLEAFQSPTGNIGCSLAGGVARCDIASRTWSPPARPSSCPDIVDFGQGIEVGRSGRARFVCAGDTARDPSSPRLAYGTGSQAGDFICVSRPTGMTCTNRFNGHGFLVNRERYELF